MLIIGLIILVFLVIIISGWLQVWLDQLEMKINTKEESVNDTDL